MSLPDEGQDIGVLVEDNWNDWYEFRTLYYLRYFDQMGARHDIGGVKIGQFQMGKDQDRPYLPKEFFELDDRFFSVGQDHTYYSDIQNLPNGAGLLILRALRDVVLDQDLFQRARGERVTGVSLLRSVTERSIVDQFRRILDGGAVLTEYSFRYVGVTLTEGVEPLDLQFDVAPESSPPTNIHVIVGRNGVGKTHLLNGMARALVSDSGKQNGTFISGQQPWAVDWRDSPFANVVSVSFSAFDDFDLIKENRNVLKSEVRYSNVGLRSRVKDKNDDWIEVFLDPSQLAKDFSASAKVCVRPERADRWKTALTTLEADPIFAEAGVTELLSVEEGQLARRAGELFRKLSSGHKIVLLTITKLVEKVEEKTLVLMDEPEAHLHPPLLSAFVRALADLLINRNGVAIVATHSPVVLQEVPANCVWKIIRHGSVSRAERPQIETFAETVGGLTHEVFGLEVTRSGFHKMLADAVGPDDTIDTVVAKFDQKVGSEGRALLSAIIACRDADGGE